MVPFYGVWIVNKAGGLIYQRTLAAASAEGGAAVPFHPRLTSNDYLVMASTLQSVHAISSKISPVAASGGAEEIRWQGEAPFTLHCLSTPTGLKIMLTGAEAPPEGAAAALLNRIYALYADYALKSPFYTPDMPIRCDLFDGALGRLFAPS